MWPALCIWWSWDDVNLGNDFTHSQAEVKRVQSKASVVPDILSFTEGFIVHRHSVQRNFSFEQFSWFLLWSCSLNMKNKCKVRVSPQGNAQQSTFWLLSHVSTWSVPVFKASKMRYQFWKYMFSQSNKERHMKQWYHIYLIGHFQTQLCF